jgi:ABC-2 type transport system ATP-binding protein
MSAAILTAEHLSKWYGQVIGLNDVTVSVPPGITGLLGPNGAGKSTFMKLITGQLRPSKGQVRVLGEPIWGNPALYFRVGFCPEQDAFYDRMTGLEWVTALVRLNGLDERAATAAAERAIEAVDLTHAAGKRIGAYSKGMRQRIKLAQSICHGPSVLVLDEPLNGLDPLVRAETIALFRALAEDGMHVIISSHILHEVDAISDQVILLSNGYVVAEGKIRGVRSEMQDHPMQILVRCNRPGALAAKVFEQDSVVEAQIHKDGLGVLVKTKDPDKFYLLLNHIAQNGVTIESVAPADDDVNSVYEYLIGSEEAGR